MELCGSGFSTGWCYQPVQKILSVGSAVVAVRTNPLVPVGNNLKAPGEPSGTGTKGSLVPVTYLILASSYMYRVRTVCELRPGYQHCRWCFLLCGVRHRHYSTPYPYGWMYTRRPLRPAVPAYLTDSVFTRQDPASPY